MNDEALLDELRERVKLDPSNTVPTPTVVIARAERELGFALPSLLRRVYQEVADGGFGPGFGLFPLQRARAEAEIVESLVEVREKLAGDPAWPQLLLPICDWGCAIWSCLDCRTDDGAIVTLAGEAPLVSTGHDLRSWLRAWLSHRDLWAEMFEPGVRRTGINAFTKQPMEFQGQGKPRGRAWQ
jgi:hypothetical protein